MNELNKEQKYIFAVLAAVSLLSIFLAVGFGVLYLTGRNSLPVDAGSVLPDSETDRPIDTQTEAVTPDTAELAELRRENEFLQQQAQDLRTELDDLKQAITEAETEHIPAPPSDYDSLFNPGDLKPADPESLSYTFDLNEQLAAYYQNGWSHTFLPDRSYQYVGIYANGGGNNTIANGKLTNNLDANLTAITHIPQARIIITCRLEMSILRRSRNLSLYNGKDYAFTVTETGKTPTGGDIYAGNSYTAIYPVSYMDLDGNIHPFTEVEAADPAFANLILKSSNAYTFALDGYGPYMSANLSITKEIGDHVSLSFFANNFTNSRPYVKSMATGVGAIFTPAFYYGLTCRLKF